MAGNLTNIGEELALNLLFRNTDTKPSTISLGLATAPVEDADELTTITEEDDAGYSRQVIDFTAPSDNGNGDTEITNNAIVEFGPWDANADNAITHAFLVDDQDRLLTWFELPQSKTPATGETLTVPVNELVFNID